MDREAWLGYSPWGCKELARLSNFHFSLFVRSRHRPRGTGSAGLMHDLPASWPFLFCDCTGPAGHTSDTEDSRPLGAGFFLGWDHCFPLPLLCLHLGLMAPPVHALDAPTLNGFGSISSEVISFKGSSGLGLLSVASLCLVIVHRCWGPPAEGVIKTEAPVHCGHRWGTGHHYAWSLQCLGEPLEPHPALAWALGSYCSFTDRGRQRKGHRLWSHVVLDSSLISTIHPFVLWTKLLSFSEYPFPASKIRMGMAAHSSILAWRFPRTDEPGGLQSFGVTKSRTWLNDFHFHTHKK